MMVHIHLEDLLYLKIIFRSTLRIIVLSLLIDRGAGLLHKLCGSVVSKGL